MVSSRLPFTNLFFFQLRPQFLAFCQLVDIFSLHRFSFQENTDVSHVPGEGRQGNGERGSLHCLGGGLLSLTDGWHVQPLRLANTPATCDVCGKKLARQSDMPRHKRLHDPEPDRW